MNCENCKQSYDIFNRIPKLLPNCGHSICSKCLSSNKNLNAEFFQCSLDGIAYLINQNYNDNLFILNQLKEQKIQKNACRVHKKTLNIFCFDCKVKICVNCVLFGQHKMHNYNEVDSIDQQNHEIESQILNQFQDIESNYFKEDFDINTKIDQIKLEQKQRILRLFNLLKNAIKFTENKSFEKLENSDQQIKEQIKTQKTKFLEIKQKFEQIQQNQNLDFLQKDSNLKQIFNELQNMNFKQFINDFEHQTKKNLHVEIKKEIKIELEKFCTTLKVKSNLQEELISEEEIDLIKQTLTDLPINTSFKELQFDNIKQSQILNNKQEKISDFSFSDLQQALSSQSNYSIISKNSNNSKNSIFITNKKNYQNQSGFQDITNQIKIHQSQKRMTVRNPQKTNDKENKNFQNINNPLEKICLQEKIEQHINKIILKKKTCLDLSKFGVDDDTMKNISTQIKTLDKIKTIKLNHNKLTEIGVKYLLKSMKNLNVEFLFMTHNNLEDTCIDYLISFKKYNKKLKAVYITNNPLSKKGQQLKSKIQLLESKNVALVYQLIQKIYQLDFLVAFYDSSK